MFGMLLVLMMRFRPEGLLPSSRRQLEFHGGDEELADEIKNCTSRPRPRHAGVVDWRTNDGHVVGKEVVLQADHVTMRFGGLTAVNDVSMTVHQGEIVGLIGPNGAGKTTFFNCLTGMYIPPREHRDAWWSGAPAETAQGRRHGRHGPDLPEHPTLRQHDRPRNVMVGRYCRTTTGPLTSIPRGPKFKRDEATRERAQEPSTTSGSANPPSSWRATCPTATSGAWRSLEPWRPTRRCCCSTSPPPA